MSLPAFPAGILRVDSVAWPLGRRPRLAKRPWIFQSSRFTKDLYSIVKRLDCKASSSSPARLWRVGAGHGKMSNPGADPSHNLFSVSGKGLERPRPRSRSPNMSQAGQSPPRSPMSRGRPHSPAGMPGGSRASTPSHGGGPATGSRSMHGETSEFDTYEGAIKQQLEFQAGPLNKSRKLLLALHPATPSSANANARRPAIVSPSWRVLTWSSSMRRRAGSSTGSDTWSPSECWLERCDQSG